MHVTDYGYDGDDCNDDDDYDDYTAIFPSESMQRVPARPFLNGAASVQLGEGIVDLG